MTTGVVIELLSVGHHSRMKWTGVSLQETALTHIFSEADISSLSPHYPQHNPSTMREVGRTGGEEQGEPTFHQQSSHVCKQPCLDYQGEIRRKEGEGGGVLGYRGTPFGKRYYMINPSSPPLLLPVLCV